MTCSLRSARAGDSLIVTLPVTAGLALLLPILVPAFAAAQAQPSPDASATETAPETGNAPSPADDDMEPEAQAPGDAELEEDASPSEPTFAPEAGSLDPATLSLDDVAPDETAAIGEADWTQPIPVLTLHGYMRVRGEMQETFWLGRGIDRSGTSPDPFTPFRSTERLACVDAEVGGIADCDASTLSYANMRMRLSPELNLSDDVRVKMTFDAFDNVIAGSGPATFYDGSFGRTYASTLDAGTVVVRRAWAEVRNRSLGELRFGRMPAHWGLGMVQNAGNRIDDDLSTDLDRLMAITRIAGLYVTAAYDFTGEGPSRRGPSGLWLDGSQRDDVDQFSFSVSHRLTPEQEQDALARGEYVIQAGGMLNYRLQDAAIASETLNPPPAPAPDATGADPRDALVSIGAETFHIDAWGQLKWRGLRVEAEAALVVGSVSNTLSGGGSGKQSVLQFGAALETEIRLLDDKLGLYFYSGFASGDPESNGLSSDANFVAQGGADNTISTFRFHPTYRVDLILWRNLMQQVTGAYYFKPGVSYDFARDPFGQLLGARVDLIWSRAVFGRQTWGGDPNLGVELNASIYWRGEDGPEIDDGFHAILQGGILFPMQGLWYRGGDLAAATFGGDKTEQQTATTLRLILGVVF